VGVATGCECEMSIAPGKASGNVPSREEGRMTGGRDGGGRERGREERRKGGREWEKGGK